MLHVRGDGTGTSCCCADTLLCFGCHWQALKEAKKKPRWLPDMLGKAAHHQQQQGSASAGASPSAGAAHAAKASAPSSTGRTPPQQQGSSSKQQQGSPGWSFSSMFSSKKDRAKAAAAAAAAAGDTPAAEAGEAAQDHQGGHPTQQQEQAVMQQYLQQQQHVLQLVSRQLQELTTRLCQDSCHTAQAASEAQSLAGEAAADTAGDGLLELEELQQQQHQALPQVRHTSRVCLAKTACGFGAGWSVPTAGAIQCQHCHQVMPRKCLPGVVCSFEFTCVLSCC